jgi:signal transduction histidine kinase
LKIDYINNVRWRVAGLFVVLSSILYLLLAVFVVIAVSWGLTKQLDTHVRVRASEFAHAIDVENGKPHFRDWLIEVKTEPMRSMSSIQLYSKDGLLLEQYGPPGPPKLIVNNPRSPQFRMVVRPLITDGNLVGYLQVSLSTKGREEAVRQLEMSLLAMAPFLLLGIGTVGYVVADVATAPIRNNLESFKRFLADASHELNTPLSIMQVRAEMLARKLDRLQVDPSDAQMIQEASERMGRTVRDMTFLAELDAKAEQTAKEVVNINELIDSIAKQFQPKFQSKGLLLEVHADAGLYAQTSEYSLSSILINLVENAWRYTEPGGKVIIDAHIAGERIKLSVRDSGIGIPADILPHIFDRFYRGDRSRSRDSGGAGLGLSIVKSLADSNNLDIHVSSTPGQGSSFSLALKPAGAEAAQKMPIS